MPKFNKHTGGQQIRAKVILKLLYQSIFYAENKENDLLCINLINVRSGIRSVRLGKSTKINKRTGHYYSSP